MMRGAGFLTRIGCSAARTALACAVALVIGTAMAADAESTQRITPNFKDADITQIAEAVSAATGKNFIIDPRVRAQVTMLSSTPMSPDAFYQAFLSHPAGAWVRGTAGRQDHQDRARRGTRVSIRQMTCPTT